MSYRKTLNISLMLIVIVLCVIMKICLKSQRGEVELETTHKSQLSNKAPCRSNKSEKLEVERWKLEKLLDVEMLLELNSVEERGSGWGCTMDY